MKRHLNTLFVTTEGAYLARRGEAVEVRVDNEVKLHVPLHTLDGIVCFGGIGASPWLLGRCAELGVTISFASQTGRFLAAVHGFAPGNVLLRREQYRRADDPAAAPNIARAIVSAKLANSRTVLLRAVRDAPDGTNRVGLRHAAELLARSVDRAQSAESLDVLRGMEGEGANAYFGVLGDLISPKAAGFVFDGRNRRPPRDPVNAMLSFAYAILAHDARSACEATGLDAAVGFLHRDRPGRPGLALDLMEEFRAFLADRLILSLINRQQVSVDGFCNEEGAIRMNDATRKTLLVAYQQRKQETITHPFLGEETTVGLLLHLQARLLARHLRGDLDAYPAFVWR